MLADDSISFKRIATVMGATVMKHAIYKRMDGQMAGPTLFHNSAHKVI